MAFDAYIKIDEIPGEALDEKYNKWIEVTGYDFGVSQSTSATASSAGGATSGRTAVSNFGRLDEQLSKMAAFGASLRNQGSIKRTLGISTKSYLHTGEITGYTDKVAGVGKAANMIKKGSYIGIALGVGAAGLDIHRACTLGREEECSKVKFVEGASLAGGLAGASAGGYAGAIIGPAVCLALGLPSGGTGSLVCAVVGGAIGGKYVGDYGAEKGKNFGEVLYRESLK